MRGDALRRNGIFLRVLIGCVLAVLLARVPAASAACRALVVSGDPGSDKEWAGRFDDWRARWQKLLTGTYAFPAANVQVLSVAAQNSGRAQADEATRENVLAACGKLVKESTDQDQVVLVIVGHAYRAQGEICKVALAGAHLADADLGLALRGLKAKQFVCFYMAPEGDGFARALAGPNRVTIVASTKQSAPVFCEFMLRALGKGGVNLLDAFNQASAQATLWYQNQFSTGQGQEVSMTVHGKEFQEIFHHLYPSRKMEAGKDEPQPPVNDPNAYDQWLGRRVIAEEAGLDDDGDGEVSTLFASGKEPKPLPNKESKDGAVAKTFVLGKN
jgi:hypothetical protein